VALPSCETGSSVKAPKGRGLDRTFHCGRTFAVSRLTNIRELITYPESVDQTRASLAELAEEQGHHPDIAFAGEKSRSRPGRTRSRSDGKRFHLSSQNRPALQTLNSTLSRPIRLCLPALALFGSILEAGCAGCRLSRRNARRVESGSCCKRDGASRGI